ncbi:MAG: hypothetical protein M1556_03550 [Candidatus Thermoplasmatota archaeon]|nr:hypothetical protein [Candidatus Thermoplasmatota archaeon]MCL6002700.1 hypothetical protein [Candidatus Thermoplasmatota archaeon]
MFDEETVNAFSGGYKVSESGVSTLFGLPAVSNLKRVISFPVSLSINSLVRGNEGVVWRGVNTVELPFEISKLTNAWYDPIKLMTNISIQRGWKKAPYILADEQLSYQLSLGYYSAFVDLLVQSFSCVNDVTLSASEMVQISGEIQDKIRGYHNSYETIARKLGKEGSMLFYDTVSNSYRNEMVSFEPYSMFLVSENSLDINNNFLSFQKSFKKFNESSMIDRDPSTLGFPYVGIRNHMRLEDELFERAIRTFNNNDVQSFVTSISNYSQSLGYNLNVLSDFQKLIARFLEKYAVNTFSFNVSEYSGSVLVFADSLDITKIKDNVIRDYYNLTNRTLRIDELSIAKGSSMEPIRI